MELRLCRYFVAVAEELNFTRAAERLHTAQPSLSQQIRQLEEEIGTPLFHRDKHRVQLTEAGLVFLREARIVLEAAARAVNLARQSVSLKIGLLPGPAAKILPRMAPILACARPNYPFDLRTLSSPRQLQALQNREIDVGIIHGRNESDNDIVSKLLFKDRLVAIVPANHALAEQERVTPDDLAQLPLVQVERAFAPVVHDAMYLLGRNAGVHFDTLLETDSLITALNTVAAGLGFSLFAKYAELVLPAGTVAKPVDADPVPEIAVFVAYRQDNKSPQLSSFLKMLLSLFTEGDEELRGT